MKFCRAWYITISLDVVSRKVGLIKVIERETRLQQLFNGLDIAWQTNASAEQHLVARGMANMQKGSRRKWHNMPNITNLVMQAYIDRYTVPGDEGGWNATVVYNIFGFAGLRPPTGIDPEWHTGHPRHSCRDRHEQSCPVVDIGCALTHLANRKAPPWFDVRVELLQIALNPIGI